MSRTTPQVLKECHRLRRHLRELQGEIDLGPRVLKLQQAQLAAAEQAHKDAHDHVKKLKLKQKDDEISLKQTETSLAKYQTDINSAGSKKEFDAKTTEIATATAKKSDLEDAILTGIGAIEDRTAELPQVEAAWAAAQAEFARQQAGGKDRLARLVREHADATAKLAEVETQLAADVRPQYDRLVKRYGADGLAGVAGRACQQCRATLTESLKATLAGGAFMCCSQCGRGLYVADATE